jgi:sulfhydrogenase subunit delta
VRPRVRFLLGPIAPTSPGGASVCNGPMHTPNTGSPAAGWVRLGESEPDLVRAFRGFNAYAEAFRRESEAHEDQKP